MRKEVKFVLDEVKENGEFLGTAAVYGNVDRGGDMIVRGAFTKTIGENGGKVPLLLDHKFPIGIADISDSPAGLKTHAFLNLEKPLAQETYSDLKFYQSHGKPYGMSIGYKNIGDPSYDGNVRKLKEIQLYETSLTLMPMNPRAAVDLVKSEELAELMDEFKSGRTLSAATIRRMKEILDSHAQLMSQFQALMSGPASEDDGKSVNGTSDEAEAAKTAATEPPTQDSTELDAVNSALTTFKSNFAGALTWN